MAFPSHCQMFIASVFVLGLSAFAGVSTASPVAARDTCIYTCGSVCYWQTDIDAALAKGYSLYQSGSTLGKNPPNLNTGIHYGANGPSIKAPISTLTSTTTTRALASRLLRRGMSFPFSQASRCTLEARRVPTGSSSTRRANLIASLRTLEPAVTISLLARRTRCSFYSFCFLYYIVAVYASGTICIADRLLAIFIVT